VTGGDEDLGEDVMGPPITGMDRILREERELAVECIFDVIDRVLDDLCEEA
jgi:hypothetical protein